MNNSARVLGTTCCGIAVFVPRILRSLQQLALFGLLVGAFATAPAVAQPATQLDGLRGNGPEARFRLSGTVKMAGKWYASIADKYAGRPVSEWLTIDDFRAGFYVKEITKNSVTLLERRTGTEHKLYIAGSADSQNNNAEKHGKDWINSAENPMYYAPSSLPLDISRDWPNLSNEDKTQIIEMYRGYGWNMIVAESVAGSTQLAWENIYEKERIAAVEKAKSDFEKSLNPDQQAIFAKIKATVAPVQSRGAPSSEEQRMGDEIRRTEWAKLFPTLTSEQRAIHEAISDSRKAMKRME
jgi:hypothetical protein